MQQFSNPDEKDKGKKENFGVPYIAAGASYSNINFDQKNVQVPSETVSNVNKNTTNLENQKQQAQKKTYEELLLDLLATDILRDVEAINLSLDMAKTPSENAIPHLEFAASEANSILQKLVKDKTFHEAVKRLAKARNQHKREIKEILNDLNNFLKKEKELLIETWPTQKEADEIINLCQKLDKNEVEEIRFQNLISSIKDISLVVNDLTTNLRNKEILEEDRWHKIWEIIKNAGVAIGGTALITVNTNALITQKISPAESAVSGAFGGGLIGTAVQNLSEMIAIKKHQLGRPNGNDFLVSNLYLKSPSVYFAVYLLLGYFVEALKLCWKKSQEIIRRMEIKFLGWLNYNQ